MDEYIKKFYMGDKSIMTTNEPTVAKQWLEEGNEVRLIIMRGGELSCLSKVSNIEVVEKNILITIGKQVLSVEPVENDGSFKIIEKRN